jgi:hypothetical protein
VQSAAVPGATYGFALSGTQSCAFAKAVAAARKITKSTFSLIVFSLLQNFTL